MALLLCYDRKCSTFDSESRMVARVTHTDSYFDQGMCGNQGLCAEVRKPGQHTGVRPGVTVSQTSRHYSSAIGGGKNQSLLCEVTAVIALNDKSTRRLSAQYCLNCHFSKPLQIFKVTSRYWAYLKLLSQVQMNVIDVFLVVFFFSRLTQTHFWIIAMIISSSLRSSHSPRVRFGIACCCFLA